MKITRTAEKINLNQVVDVSVDVHKETLNFFFVIDGREYYDECRNRTALIEARLKNYLEIVSKHGRKNLRIICEPTGQYQNSLQRTARRLGCFTCLVNAESVAKFRVVESNDNGKTDSKDPRVIQTLGRLGKVIKHRLLSEDYLMLRKLGKIVEELERECTRARCKLDRLLVELFCDYSFKKDFLYSNSGLGLVEQYGCNPYRIVAAGYKNFCRTMKRAAPRIKRESLERLWRDAQSSALNEMPDGYVAVLEDRLYQLMEDYLKQLERKEEVEEQMIEILGRIREEDPLIPPPTPGVISARNLARLLGETGPLSDFAHWRKLMRYFGLNIRMRQSGSYYGQNKISKKGRPLGRKVLSQIVLPLVRRNCLYGEYYQRKRETDKMVGNKAMVVIARQFLRKFFGWYKSGQAFDKDRFFKTEAECLKLAA
jgi:transposase